MFYVEKENNNNTYKKKILSAFRFIKATVKPKLHNQRERLWFQKPQSQFSIQNAGQLLQMLTALVDLS